ncbi:16S rRNA (guanine527-N7)-methyltransferase [Aliiroseovarius crassostreae]|uniref:Ribosomal RNA small subunit methyltransferase G n=1 Tax=Aliiroseovarius crassostreae TaxID=154981 RepID=A0A0P7JKD4_9RHOB|nr:16S rRNA (guanine(527)-N(7))-methyltransferase RsmG [Aliiroseovarius crassostreae]KPN61573.1 16S rRNA (guanine(527)-N(7))-methyltransferase RsmG [Aliiroseovarius crassostreae]SFU57218.1 16S rRNA (guanine527-N7)-methyltransferase [Aliiroseovarius crassostreae]
MTDTKFFSRKFDVSRETLERLKIYASLLKKWNPAINLVAPSTINDLWERHFLDSAQVFSALPQDATKWCDVGTGGGFPGLIVAMLAQEKAPELQITCIESDLRKATFLRTVLRETGVKAKVLSERIESAEPQGADVFSARALASLDKLLEFSERHLSPDGICVFQKGVRYQEEVEEALENWSFQLDKIPSVTNSDAVILKIGAIKRA